MQLRVRPSPPTSSSRRRCGRLGPRPDLCRRFRAIGGGTLRALPAHARRSCRYGRRPCRRAQVAGPCAWGSGCFRDPACAQGRKSTCPCIFMCLNLELQVPWCPLQLFQLGRDAVPHAMVRQRRAARADPQRKHERRPTSGPTDWGVGGVTSAPTGIRLVSSARILGRQQAGGA